MSVKVGWWLEMCANLCCELCTVICKNNCWITAPMNPAVQNGLQASILANGYADVT